MSEWSEEKCLLLIDAYKDNSVLWNPKDKDYYKKHLKEDAWAKIGGIIHESGEACKQKMINILASFRRERMKIKKSMGTGKGKDEIYESNWYAFKVLGFLNDRFTPRKGLEAGDTMEPVVVDELENNNANNSTASLDHPSSKKLKPDPKLQMLKEAFGILKSTANKPQQDMELKSFFDFIQEKMKNYSRDIKNTIQHEIFQIIMRADQGYYDSTQHHSYYTTTQNQQATRQSYSSIATDVTKAGPSQDTYSSQDSPYSVHSNSSQYSSDMNLEEYV